MFFQFIISKRYYCNNLISLEFDLKIVLNSLKFKRLIIDFFKLKTYKLKKYIDLNGNSWYYL